MGMETKKIRTIPLHGLSSWKDEIDLGKKNCGRIWFGGWEGGDQEFIFKNVDYFIR